MKFQLKNHMYYRRKTVFSLLEVFGNELEKSGCKVNPIQLENLRY